MATVAHLKGAFYGRPFSPRRQSFPLQRKSAKISFAKETQKTQALKKNHGFFLTALAERFWRLQNSRWRRYGASGDFLGPKKKPWLFFMGPCSFAQIYRAEKICAGLSAFAKKAPRAFFASFSIGMCTLPATRIPITMSKPPVTVYFYISGYVFFFNSTFFVSKGGAPKTFWRCHFIDTIANFFHGIRR